MQHKSATDIATIKNGVRIWIIQTRNLKKVCSKCVLLWLVDRVGKVVGNSQSRAQTAYASQAVGLKGPGGKNRSSKKRASQEFKALAEGAADPPDPPQGALAGTFNTVDT